MRYDVYESLAFGVFRVASTLEADGDRDALKQARGVLPAGSGELRQKSRVVCRFGRTGSLVRQP